MASQAKAWADVGKGDRVEVRGRTFEVVKIKPNGKRAKVTLSGAGIVSKGEVKLKDAVTVVAAGERWAKATKTVKAEQRAVLRTGLPPGDPAQLKPPVKASGDPWETASGKVERLLDKYLSAHLVGESLDEGGGYYVPPQDVDTIAAHLVTFHGADWVDDMTPTAMLAQHDLEHRDVLRGEQAALHVNHWHTETRP